MVAAPAASAVSHAASPTKRGRQRPPAGNTATTPPVPKVARDGAAAAGGSVSSSRSAVGESSSSSSSSSSSGGGGGGGAGGGGASYSGEAGSGSIATLLVAQHVAGKGLAPSLPPAGKKAPAAGVSPPQRPLSWTAFRGVELWKCKGELLLGKPHGKGTKTFENGDKYEGDMADGKRHGKGTYTWADGRKYEGDMSSQGLLFSEARKPCAEAAGHGRRGWCTHTGGISGQS